MDVRMFVVLLAAGVCCISVEGTQLLEDKLKSDLMYEYDPETIPIADPVNGDPVNVSINLSVIGIEGFENNILSLDVWIFYAWSDFRLKWDSSKWNDLTKIYVPSKKLWIPDVVLFNSAMDEGQADRRSFRAVVNSDGSLIYVPTRRLKAYCQNSEETYTSNGGQYVCGLKFGSWVYSGSLLNTLTTSNGVNLNDLNTSNQWEITNTSMTRNVKRYECCPEPYIDVTFSLTFREKVSYHP